MIESIANELKRTIKNKADFFTRRDLDYGLILNELNTSNITNMYGMFQYSTKATINIQDWNVSNVTNMAHMFDSCYNLTSLDLSNWDVSNVTDMYRMFYYCSSLTSVNLSNWDIPNVSNAFTYSTTDEMFGNCAKLTEVRLDNCNHDTIRKIIKSTFPDHPWGGIQGYIYCKESEAAGLTPPKYWKFSLLRE